MAASVRDEDWELCNDDGFVYKRKRRRIDDPSDSNPPTAPDPRAEEKLQIQRRRRTLLKLRHKYEQEVLQWETLLNGLRAMEVQAKQQQLLEQQQETDEQRGSPSPLLSTATPSQPERSPELASRPFLDELLVQAEIQEATISDVSNLCDIAEAVCDSKEDRRKQEFIDLPVWCSPRQLMASLCDD